MPQLLEESSGRTAYQPSVRILKRDRAADTARSTNQSVYIININLFNIYYAEINVGLYCFVASCRCANK